MIVWLSDWLRGIISVILLAVIVELMLPNKAMQRYARLVVGLFILLTILSPVLKLLQTDIAGRLDAGMALWDERTMSDEVKMPGLAEIERRAADIRARRDEEAARLTGAALEEAVYKELAAQLGNRVDGVRARLVWNEHPQAGRMPDIDHMTITLRPSSPVVRSEDDRSPIGEVEPVVIGVAVELDRAAAVSSQEEDEAGFTEAERSDAATVRSVLQRGWGVQPDRVTIRQTVNEADRREDGTRR